VSGIILGLDSDSKETEGRLLEFIRRSNIPMLTINLLQALPRTPLWDRLAAAGRLRHDPTRESNVDFLLPYGDVVDMWRHCVREAYRPEEVYRRFAWNIAHTYPNRIRPPMSPRRASWANLRKAARILAGLSFHAGILARYRRHFWRMALPLLRQGRIEDVIRVGLVAHHLITFAHHAALGRENASFYSAKVSRPAAAAA
jgi:hopanoid C-2 methylase